MNWRSFSAKTIYALVISLLVSIFVASCSSIPSLYVNARFFQTVATIQGALFAIVFSVIILGVQLSANRYSPRVGEIYRSDPAYRWTFFIFGISIGIALFGVFSPPTVDSYISNYTAPVNLVNFLVLETIAISLVAFWTLYRFVSYILYQTTPSGFLSRIQSHLSPAYILSQAKEADSSSTEPDPFLVLITSINSSIEMDDETAAASGLEVVEESIRETLNKSAGNQYDKESPIFDSIRKLCTGRLVNTGYIALSNNSLESAEKVLTTYQNIVSIAVDVGASHIIIYPLKGLFELTGEMQFDANRDRVRQKSIELGMSALQEVAEAKFWIPFRDGIRVGGWRVAQSIQQRSKDNRHGRVYNSLIINYIPDIFKKSINHINHEFTRYDVDWIQGVVYETDELSEEEMVLHSFLLALSEITSALVRYNIRTEKPLVEWQFVARGWSKCLDSITEQREVLHKTWCPIFSRKYDSFSIYWIATMLYIDYLIQHLPETPSMKFNSEIRRAVPKRLIDKAITGIQRGEVSPQASIDLQPGIIDPTEVPGLTGFTDSLERDSDIRFEDWLNRQQKITAYSRFGDLQPMSKNNTVPSGDQSDIRIPNSVSIFFDEAMY